MVLKANSLAYLQHKIDKLHLYCNTWRVELNVEKTNVVGFLKKSESTY